MWACIEIYIYMVLISMAHVSKHRQDFYFQKAFKNIYKSRKMLCDNFNLLDITVTFSPEIES